MSKYVINFEDNPWYQDECVGYYKCGEIPWWSAKKTDIKKLTPLDKELEEAYQKGYDAAWVNVGECEDRVAKQAYQKGFEAGQHEATTLEYQQGLDDAWGTIIKIALIPYAERSEIFDGQQDILSIVQKFSPSEVIAKLREYEQQKADDEIKVGDEVDYKGMTKYVVTGIVDDDTICGFSLNGLWNANTIKEVTKTGRHFPQVAELLKAMIGGAE